jgi:hypothetical protein
MEANATLVGGDQAMTAITKMLDTLKTQNDEDDYSGILKQAIGRPEPLGRIATLGLRSRELSPMLVDRFRFAGEWVNAVGAQRWLSLRQIRASLRAPPIKRVIALRFKYGEQLLVSSVPRECLTLFGIDEEECEETYLLWTNAPEPKVVTYISYQEQVYKHLKAYLAFVTAR